MGEKDILTLSDAATYDKYVEDLMECKLLSEEDVESLCKKVSVCVCVFFCLRSEPLLSFPPFSFALYDAFVSRREAPPKTKQAGQKTNLNILLCVPSRCSAKKSSS